ncbi:MAG TPA: molybdopterin oxidoreductase family protein, partial [Terriglobia bacterium]|nr:molybdopterin oxidoreductase family protein [Terriglobia bacterium]
LSPSALYPVNLGMACPKGWEALAPLSASDRGTTPLLRSSSGLMEPVDWNAAMDVFSARLQGIQERYGRESIAFLSTGQMCTEEMALLGCLFKFGMGALHCDSNTRQCMATAHVAYKQSLGFDAPPFTYADFEESDTLIFIGANPCVAHPIMWQRVMRNPNRPEIVVLDPRKTETAQAASQHYALLPKSDLTLLCGLANRLIAMNAVDRAFVDAHTSGFASFAEFVSAFEPERVTAASGLSHEQLERLATTIARGKRVSFWWTMGVNQSHEATRTAQAIINLALITGNIGRPGTGANSITGQCNAMGSRIYSNITNLIGGHDFADPSARRKVSSVLAIPEDRIPYEASWSYDQIVQGIEDDRIKGLWIIATNSSHSWIHHGEFNRLLKKLEFLVVQDMYPTTETAVHADLYLPAAGWGEKEGTLINSERRIGVVRKVRRAPGQALADFHIFKLVADRWGCGDLFSRWSSPEAAFQLMKEISRGQPSDISGIRDYSMIDECGGIQWPWPESASGARPVQERRLFEDGVFFTPDGRARLLFDEPRPVPEKTDDEFPLVLLTGRGTSAQWHTGSRTNKSAVLRALAPSACYVEISPRDAKRAGLTSGGMARVSSRRGSFAATAFVTATMPEGQVFVPMHYAEVNLVTYPAFDPHSRQPSYKYCAVSVRRL